MKIAYKNYITILALCLMCLLLFSCSEDEGEITEALPPPQLESIDLPSKMALNSDYFHYFQAGITGDLAGIAVTCIMLDSLDSEIGEFTLRDDAGAFEILDEPDFASVFSGDVVAGDGIFTRKVNSLFTDYEGYFSARFIVTACDSDMIFQDEYPLEVYENQPPQLYTPNLPSILVSGFEPFNLEIEVTDPQGYSDIAAVQFEVHPLGNEYPMEDPENDGFFTYYLEASFAAGIFPADYVFIFTAIDSIGEISAPVNVNVYIENDPPILIEPMLEAEGITTYPSSGDSLLSIPDPGDTTMVKVTVKVSDPQTLLDIDSVYINYQRPTGIWTMGYPMADNGLEWDLELYLQGLPYLGDETAGDSVFTFTKPYTFEVDPGLHQFHFQCYDKANQPADSISINLWFE